MAAEIEQLYLQTLLGNNREAVGDHLQGTVDFLKTTEHDYRWELLQKGLDRAAEAIREEKPVLYYVVDDTSAGGRHAIEAVYTPTNKRVMIGVPETSREDQKGHFPTILHTIEFITATVMLANQQTHEENRIQYPDIYFAPNDENRVSQVVTRNIPDIETIMVPLTVDPPRTNAIFVHTQTRHIDPETLARSYYEVIKMDPDLSGDIIRHTMLFHPKDKTLEQPPNKNLAFVQVVPHDELKEHRLVDLRRVQQWDQLRNPSHEQASIQVIQSKSGKFIIPATKQ